MSNKKEETWEEISRRAYDQINVEDLPVCGIIIDALKAAKLNTVLDIVNYCQRLQRLFYLPGIRKCDDREIMEVLRDCGIRFLYPTLDAVEFMNLYYPGAYEGYQCLVQSRVSIYTGLDVTKRVGEVFSNKKLAKTLRDNCGETIADIMAYKMIHGGLQGIKGIGQKYETDVDNFLISAGLRRDFCYLDSRVQEQVRLRVLNTSLLNVINDHSTYLELYKQGFETVRDMAMYMRRGGKPLDLYKQLDMRDRFRKYGYPIVKAINAVDAVNCTSI